MRVCKFGGSSLSDAKAFARVCDIVRAQKERRFIVVSAPGRRHAQDEKITDLLYACHAAAQDARSFDGVFARIAARYREIARGMGAADMTEALEKTRALLQHGCSAMQAAAQGEYLCARLMAGCLGAAFVDAKDVIRFRADGRVDKMQTDALLQNALKGVPLAVIPGFYGADAQGRVRTFARGGSDITGALVARALNADVYENWTDVCGVYMADPRIVPGARPIVHLSYREAHALSLMGAGVLQPEAVIPAQQAGVPIHLCNTFAPQHPGTWIDALPRENGPVLTGLAGRKNLTQMHIRLPVEGREGDVMRVLAAAHQSGLEIVRMQTESDGVMLLCSGDVPQETMRKALYRQGVRADIQTRKSCAAILAAGSALHLPGMGVRMLSCLEHQGICAQMMEEETGVLLIVSQEHLDNTVRAVYDAFVSD